MEQLERTQFVGHLTFKQRDTSFVSVRLVDLENLDCASSESQINGSSDSGNLAVYLSSVCISIGSCKIPYPHQLFKYNNVLTPHCQKSCISYLLSIVNATNIQLVAAIFNVLEN